MEALNKIYEQQEGSAMMDQHEMMELMMQKKS